MRRFLFQSVFISLIIMHNTSCLGQGSKDFEPKFKVSKKTTHKINSNQEYIFGYLEVLENRNKPKGNTIKLPVYIFKSRNPNPKKDPIIYTVGGPGNTTMRTSQYMEYYKYLDDRDFILFEQRGTQYAKPHLDCPAWAEAIYLSNLPDFDESKHDYLFEKAATDCKERLTKKGIDLNNYNTNAIAADIADLKNALDIKTYNLLTLSYSTKIAQVLMRDYPEGIRSVVMDSPLPLEAHYDEESITNLMEAVDKLLSDCANDSTCNDTFPDLRRKFLNYLETKTLNPLEVSIINPNNGKREMFFLKGYDLISVFSIATTDDVPNIPLEINKLLNNDLSLIKEYLISLFSGPGSGSGIGMRLSVWCAEEYPFADQKVIKNQSVKYPQLIGASSNVFDESICEIWGVKKVATLEDLAIKSDIPVLLINGEYDESTPPKWATAMVPNFSNCYHLIFKGWKHGPTTNWSNPCAMQAANDFFNNPNIKPNPDCLSEITSPLFKTK